MKICIDLQERFGRNAQITFEDNDVDYECSEDVRHLLEYDLTTFIAAVGGLAVSAIEDRLADVPDRHRIMDEIIDLIEHYCEIKLQNHPIIEQK